jgi:NADH:ubiquinone oxidoreductase subunit 6 (subunit J)
LFFTLAASTVICSIAVVVTQNVVRMAVWLLFALGATAGLFFLFGADFVAAAQLLIYVGGTLVLVVFGVMLTARGPFVQMQTRSVEWTLAAVVGTTLFLLLAGAIFSTAWPARPSLAGEEPIDTEVAAGQSPTAIQFGLAFLGVPPQDPAVPRDPAHIGYLLPFEIVSVHLLVVLIGAAYLARAKRRRAATP